MQPTAPGGTGYLHALKYRWLTPLYDPVMRWLYQDSAMKGRLVDRIALRGGERVLDVGCGTGTLSILLKSMHPDAYIVGTDGDQEILDVARRKAAVAGVEVEWDSGTAYSLPYPQQSFDVAVASLVLHHLPHDGKALALREIHRVLRPAGHFHVAEFAPPHSPTMRVLAKVSEVLEETEDGVEGRLPALFREAGFVDLEETDAFRTPSGQISLFHCRRPPRKHGEDCDCAPESISGVSKSP